MTTDNRPGAQRYSAAARLTLIAALALILSSLAVVVYRMNLPTDGWLVVNASTTGSQFEFYQDLEGEDFALQRGDVLIGVEGLDLRDVPGQPSKSVLPRPSSWATGEQVTYTVLRGEQRLNLPVTLVRWRPVDILRTHFITLSTSVSTIGYLLMLAIGFFTFFKRPDTPSTWALLLLCAASGAANLTSLLPGGVTVQFYPLVYWLTIFLGNMIFAVVLAPALLTFTLLFPRPKQIFQRQPWLALLPLAAGGALLLAMVLTGQGTIGWIATMLMFILAIFSMIHSAFTQRDAVSRAQLRWALGGFSLGLGTALLTFPAAFGWVTDPFWAELLGSGVGLGFTFSGLCLSIAILRYRLFDIDVIIRRTLQYSLVTGLLALVYFGSVLLGQRLAGALTGEPDSPLVLVVSTLLVAALFNPLRQRVQEFIDRRFYRRKYDALQTLAAFTRAARDETRLEALEPALLAAIQDSLQPEQAWLWLSDKKRHAP